MTHSNPRPMTKDEIMSDLAKLFRENPLMEQLHDPDLKFINAADLYKHVDTTQSYMLWIVAVLKRCKLKDEEDYKRITLLPDSPDNIEQIAKGRNVVTYVTPWAARKILFFSEGRLPDAVGQYGLLSAALLNILQGEAA